MRKTEQPITFKIPFSWSSVTIIDICESFSITYKRKIYVFFIFDRQKNNFNPLLIKLFCDSKIPGLSELQSAQGFFHTL